MKIATWNVNSLRVRLLQVLNWLQAHPVDMLCLQELKLTDADYPVEKLQEAGYHSIYAGQKTYNGVAILSRTELAINHQDVLRDIPDFEDSQRRIVAATISDVRVVCAYFPNGQAPGTDKFIYKLGWITALTHWLANELKRYPQLILIGDFNIAPEDRDVHDPAAWLGQNLVSPEERAALAGLAALGLTDAFRLFDQPEKIYSWWDYRRLGFRRNAGLRIDHIFLSPTLAARCIGCEVDRTPRGWEQASDHAPVIATLNWPA